MHSYIALLRGINVGGHKKINMSKLRELCEQIGLEKVCTYIQSGNVVFQSEKKKDELVTLLQHAIENTFGFVVDITVYTANEMTCIIDECPYESENLHVAFLFTTPSAEKLANLQNVDSGKDRYMMKNNAIYLSLTQRFSESKVAKHVSKLGVLVTVRNWKTTITLVDLAKKLNS